MIFSIFKIPKNKIFQNKIDHRKNNTKKFEKEFIWFSKLARNKLNEYSLNDWNIGFDYAERRAGACFFDKKLLSFSVKFLKNANKEEINDTILHEIAHALVGPGNGHNSKWKKKAKEIGCTGRIYYENEFATPKWIKYCEQGCWWVKCYRRKKNLICKKCKSNVRFKKYNSCLKY